MPQSAADTITVVNIWKEPHLVLVNFYHDLAVICSLQQKEKLNLELIEIRHFPLTQHNVHVTSPRPVIKCKQLSTIIDKNLKAH